jgi:hypothetical protein
MKAESTANMVIEAARDPRWPWVITAAQLQRMTFPDEPPRRRKRASAQRSLDTRDWWNEGDARWRAA